MKNIFLAFSLLFALTISAQDEINWVSLEEAVELQKKEPKKIIMDAYTSWCGPCKMLDARTFKNKDVVDYVNKNYYAVKLNAEGNEKITFKGRTYVNPKYDPAKAMRRNSSHELSRALGIRAYPTILFFDEQAELIAPLPGFKTVPQLELYLKMFKLDKHKEMVEQSDFNTYYKAFDYTFKE